MIRSAFVVLSFLVAQLAWAQGSSVSIPLSAVPPTCKIVEGKFPVDVQTAILYDRYDTYKSILPAVKTKSHQSFDCSGTRGTIFYFDYAGAAEREHVGSFVRPLLWGESGPTPMHPEQIVESGSVLAVVSFKQPPEGLVAALRNTLGASALSSSGVNSGEAAKELDEGRASHAQHDLKNAEKHFRKAAELDPGNLQAALLLGHLLFQQERFADAIAPYEHARRLNASSKALDKTTERVLNDQLGMSYGISGQLDISKALFQQAVKDDPDYALYRYNLACAIAESGDLDSTLETLAGALQRRKNVIAGEEFPNPRQDSSFKRFLGQERFEALLKQYGYSKPDAHVDGPAPQDVPQAPAGRARLDPHGCRYPSTRQVSGRVPE